MGIIIGCLLSFALFAIVVLLVSIRREIINMNNNMVKISQVWARNEDRKKG